MHVVPLDIGGITELSNSCKYCTQFVILAARESSEQRHVVVLRLAGSGAVPPWCCEIAGL